jgi:hypothetical protein
MEDELTQPIGLRSDPGDLDVAVKREHRLVGDGVEERVHVRRDGSELVELLDHVGLGRHDRVEFDLVDHVHVAWRAGAAKHPAVHDFSVPVRDRQHVRDDLMSGPFRARRTGHRIRRPSDTIEVLPRCRDALAQLRSVGVDECDVSSAVHVRPLLQCGAIVTPHWSIVKG